MSEVMYDHSSFLIAVLLLGAMLIALELGHRLGRKRRADSDSSKEHVNAIQASLLGVLALLLGFTFSLALQRFDSRSEAVVEEANAIGTAYLRAQLLTDSVREEMQTQLRSYVDLRVRAGEVSIDHETQRLPLLAQAVAKQNELWTLARRAATDDPNPTTTGLFLQALNDMIDAYGRRDASLNRHVPEEVIFLLFVAFLMTSAVVGYSSGVHDHRPSVASYLLIALIVLLVFLILDLDRPRRGLIQVSHKSLFDVQSSMAPPVPASIAR